MIPVRFFQRNFTASAKHFKKITPHNLKGKSVSSQHWLIRQLKDQYVEKAKMMNYRCRSAFKLLEINEKYNLLRPGDTIVDCGASPGSWTQVAVREVNSDGNKIGEPRGTVIAIDKQQIYPIDGAVILGNCDFTEQETTTKVLEVLNGRKLNGVISDMAPNATGIRDMDNENMMKLCYTALKFALELSKVDAFLIMKLWQSNDAIALENDMSRFYKNVKVVKPNASRQDSAEIYLLGRNFRGLKKRIEEDKMESNE